MISVLAKHAPHRKNPTTCLLMTSHVQHEAAENDLLQEAYTQDIGEQD